jgi:hypothetical protein
LGVRIIPGHGIFPWKSDLWKKSKIDPLCAHYVPVVCPNQLVEAVGEMKRQQIPAFADLTISAFSGGVHHFVTDWSSMSAWMGSRLRRISLEF